MKRESRYSPSQMVILCLRCVQQEVLTESVPASLMDYVCAIVQQTGVRMSHLVEIYITGRHLAYIAVPSIEKSTIGSERHYSTGHHFTL
jgi:hypothetical protein